MKLISRLLIVAIVCYMSGSGEAWGQSFRIGGVVKDAKTRQGIEFANVVLQTPDSTFVSGGVSGINGRFALDKIRAGNYRLVVSTVGYRTTCLELNALTQSVELDDVVLEEDAVQLGDVMVITSAARPDRRLVYPSERQVKASSNGVDLLQQLMLPRLSVNPTQQTVALLGGGELQYRINGVKAELQDVLSIQPADVIRIEYHDNPGLRYGNAEVVLDFIVHRPETGGNTGVNIRNGLSHLEFGDYHFNGRINHKKSEFAVNYGMNYRNFRSMWRDNEEQFTFADGSMLLRKEVGEPGHLLYTNQYMNATYSFQNDQRMLSATLRYFDRNEPHFDYKGALYNVAHQDDRVEMTDNSASDVSRPALDLYYQENMSGGQTLVLNLVGTYNRSNDTRFYQESRAGDILTQVDNNVLGNKYSWIGEGIYEKAFGTNRLSAGVRHTQAYTDNHYRNGHSYITEMMQAETFLYTEFKGKLQKLDYTLGAGVTRSYYKQQGVDQSYVNYTFNPRLTLFYNFPTNSSVRLRSEITNMSPSLSELSAVDQMVDSLQIQRGNPLLKPYLRYRSELNYDFRKSIVNLNLRGQHEYRPSAIMDEKFLEGNKIVQTWNNQQSAQAIKGSMSLRIGPIKDVLQLMLRGGINHYISLGNNYRHTYTNWYTASEISGMYKNAMLGLGIETNYDGFYGETLNGGENVHYATLGYKYKEMNFMLMMLNPFVDNYKMESENRSRYASFQRKTYINDSSRFLMLRFSWNFAFGRKFSAGEKRLHNTDDDSGVMSSGK